MGTNSSICNRCVDPGDRLTCSPTNPPDSRYGYLRHSLLGGAESDVVERVNDLRGSTSSQELVPPLEGSSTADLQVTILLIIS